MTYLRNQFKAGGGTWLKQDSTCLIHTKPGGQTPIPPNTHTYICMCVGIYLGNKQASHLKNNEAKYFLHPVHRNQFQAESRLNIMLKLKQP
jgi:hypothetical protein